MNQLWITCGTEGNWQKQHAKNVAMLEEANTLVAELANDLGLVKK
jgi:hypothetical protein